MSKSLGCFELVHGKFFCKDDCVIANHSFSKDTAYLIEKNLFSSRVTLLTIFGELPSTVDELKKHGTLALERN